MAVSKTMFARMGLALAALLIASAPRAAQASGAAYQQVFADKGASGEALARAFFDLLFHTGSPSGTVGTTRAQDEASRALARPYLDPAFLLQRATGERALAETYLPADVDAFQLGDIRVTRPAEDVAVVRYSVRTMEALPDAALVMSKEKAPRLTVFHWSASDARWKILSHANFNTPIAAICNQAPVVNNGLKSPASVEDQALGERLVGAFYDLVMKGDAAPILHSDVQFQSASGAGYTALAERKKSTQYQDLRFSNAIVTRSGRLLVASAYNTTGQRTLMQDSPLRASEAGNILTFLQSSDGNWRIIAAAAFAPPKALPDGSACVKAGPIEKAP